MAEDNVLRLPDSPLLEEEDVSRPTARSSSKTALSAKHILVAVSGKFLAGISIRAFFFFAPFLSSAFVIPLDHFPLILSAGELAGMLGLLAGPLADHLGELSVILLGQLLLLLSNAAPFFSTAFNWILISRVCATIGFSLYTPCVQSLIASRASAEQQGKVAAILESSWAVSSLLGLPLVGFLLHTLRWQMLFVVLCCVSAPILVATYLLFKTKKTTHVMHQESPSLHFILQQVWRGIFTAWSPVLFCLFPLVAYIADTAFASVYGIYMEQQYHLNSQSVGLTTFVIGFAEITAAILVLSFADKWGIFACVLVSQSITAVAYILFCFLGPQAPLSIVMTVLFLKSAAAEFSLICGIPYAASLVSADVQNTMMCLYWAMMAAGGSVGPLLGQPIWEWSGIWGIGFISFICSVFCVLCIWSAQRMIPRKKEGVYEEYVINYQELVLTPHREVPVQ